MVLLNVVCFGARQKTMHEYVLSARDSGRLADSGRFRLKEWYDRPVRAPFEEFGDIGSRAVVLDACSTPPTTGSTTEDRSAPSAGR
jgi:hypothetical protein